MLFNAAPSWEISRVPLTSIDVSISPLAILSATSTARVTGNTTVRVVITASSNAAARAITSTDHCKVLRKPI